MKGTWLLIVLLACSVTLSRNAFAQRIAPKDRYLVEGLDLAALSESDSVILEDAMGRYHAADSDTGRIKALDLIVEELMDDAWMAYQFYQYDLIDQAMASDPSEAESSSLQSSLANALTNIGYIHKLRGEIDLALDHYDRALELQREVGDQSRLAQVLNNIGVIHKNQGNIALALEHYLEALKVQESLDDQLGMASSYLNLGVIHYGLEDLDLALEYYLKALELNEAIGSRKGEANVYNNIGALYKDKGDLAKALEYHERSLAIKQEIGDKAGMSDSYINVGDIYEAQGERDRAWQNFEKARMVSEEIANARGMADAYINMAKIRFAEGALQGEGGAMELARKSLRIGEEIGSPQAMRDASGILYRILTDQGKYLEALEMHELFMTMNDSVSNAENQRIASRRQAQYEYEKQKAIDDKEHDKELAVQAQEVRRQKVVRNGFMGGFVLVAVFAVVFLFQRNRIGKEMERSEELLLNILPEEVAEELKEKGEADARLIEHATVLFTDFKGFTAYSEKMSPQQLVKDLHLCFTAFDEIIDRHGMEKIKTIGDAYMAAGGLPVPNDTHAVDAVQAALEIRDFIAEGKARKIAAELPYFEVRIGIHTGPVVAGIVGVKKFSYDIWGDTVNTASRMESSGEVGRVNLSEATYALVKDTPSLTFTPRGKVQAKGKGELEMWVVHRSAERA